MGAFIDDLPFDCASFEKARQLLNSNDSAWSNPCLLSLSPIYAAIEDAKNPRRKGIWTMGTIHLLPYFSSLLCYVYCIFARIFCTGKRKRSVGVCITITFAINEFWLNFYKCYSCNALDYAAFEESAKKCRRQCCYQGADVHVKNNEWIYEKVVFVHNLKNELKCRYYM